MNILTFDIEEWFHILDHESTKTVNEWNSYEKRIHKNLEKIFLLLESTNSNATFFCLGWIAEKYPEIVREIVHKGYEIGTHSRMHQLVFEQAPKEFSDDLEYSIKTLEDISSKKVKYYRAPGFSITRNEKWAFEMLLEQGIEIDCSIFPANRSHGGFQSFGEPVPSIINYNGIELKELPLNYTKVLGNSIVFSGGGYFRLFPYWLINFWTKQSDYTMSYLHPRDFDTGQPVIKDLSIIRKFKSYIGIQGALKKLELWLSDNDFIDIDSANNLINWKTVPRIYL